MSHEWTRHESEAWGGPQIETGVNAEAAEYAEEAERGAGVVGDRGWIGSGRWRDGAIFGREHRAEPERGPQRALSGNEWQAVRPRLQKGGGASAKTRRWYERRVLTQSSLEGAEEAERGAGGVGDRSSEIGDRRFREGHEQGWKRRGRRSKIGANRTRSDRIKLDRSRAE